MNPKITYLFLFLFLISSLWAKGQTVGFTMSPSSGCNPQLVYFTNTSTGSIASYSWNFGNGASSVLKDPSTTYTSPGTYTITLTINLAGGGSLSSTSSIVIYGPPNVNLIASLAIGCRPFSTTFSSIVSPNAPGPVTYSWNFGDGSTDTAANPTHTYTVAGTYAVTLTATSGAGCSTTFTKSALIKVLGNNAFTASPLNGCGAPLNVSFSTANVTGVNTTWTYGDGSGGIGTNTTHSYLSSGAFTVRMIQYFSTPGCFDTVQKNNLIQVLGHTSNFTFPSSICQNTSVVFINTTIPIMSSWNFGDNSTGYGISATHSYLNPGTYTVRMITFIGTCEDTAINTITVNPDPFPVIHMSPALPCPAPVTINFSTSGVPAGSAYLWSWSSGGSSTAATPSKTYLNNYFFDSVRVNVTTAAGCSGSARLDSIGVNDMNLHRKVRPKPAEGCVPLTINFDSVWQETTFPDSNAYPAAITAYSWNFGDGSPLSSASNPAHVYTAYGNYVSSITLTTSNGCTISDTIHIKAGTKSPPSFNVLHDSDCISSLVLVQNNSNSIPVFNWSTIPFDGPPWVPYAAISLVKVYNIGSHPLYLTSYNNGCRDTTSRIVRTYGTGALFNHLNQCPPSLDIVFSNFSIGATSYYWDFGDGTSSTSAAPSLTHTYPSVGTYICSLYTTDANTGCTDLGIDTIVINNPHSSFAISDSTRCFGDKVIIQGSFSGTPVRYSWAVDNVNVHVRDTVTHLELKLYPGYHTITMRTVFIRPPTRDLLCIDSERKVNAVFVSDPVASFTASPIIGCSPFQVNFTSNSTFTLGAGFAQLKWEYGDGKRDSGLVSLITHSYVNPGKYDVTLSVVDSNGCSSFEYLPQLVEARKIVAAFSANRITTCSGKGIQFTGNISTGAYPLQYQWYFGDGDSSTAANPFHTYTSNGSYTVKLFVTDPFTGCFDSLVRTNYITVTMPHASFSLSDTFSICAPLIVNFRSTSTNAATFAWTFGDGNSSPFPNPTNNYTQSGIYYVRLIVTDPTGCSDTTPNKLIRILGYAGALTYRPLAGCVPLQVNFRALVTNAPNLIWDFSDGVTKPAFGDTATHIYLTPGIYVPKLIFSNNAGCISSSVGLDTLKIDQVIAGFSMSPPCVNSNIVFTDTSLGFLLPPILSQWSFDSTEIYGNPKTWHFTDTGTHIVKLVTVNWNNCRDSITKVISILPLPHVSASNDTVVCVPDAIGLSATGASTYSWAPPGTLSCRTCSNPQVNPSKPTSYIVTGTDRHGCMNSDTVNVGIQKITSFSTTDSLEVCSGKAIQLHARGASVYFWYPDSTLDHANIPDPWAKPLNSTTYFVVGKEGSCIADTQKIQLRVNPLPVVDAGADVHIIAGNPTQLQASGSGIANLVWSPDSFLSCSTCYSPLASPFATTQYYVHAYSSKGCESVDSVTVFVLCDGSQLFIPNTFSPNNDGINDRFFPRGKGITEVRSFRVFNRWGALLFERENLSVNDESAGWDGTSKGRALDPDVYVYVVEAYCSSGEKISLKGDIALMR